MSKFVGTFKQTVKPRTLAAGLAVAAVLASGCTPATGSAPTTGAESPRTTPRSGAAAANVSPDPPASCPMTIPDPPLVPPDPYLATPPASYNAAWHGTSDLWTMVDLQGEVWRALPHDANGFTQKTFWWSRWFKVDDEPQPAISVSGRRLDAVGSRFETKPPGTNATADFGTSMLVGVEIPTAGCWSIKAAYRDHALEYVVWVAAD